MPNMNENQIKTINFTGQLYRADNKTAYIGNSADKNYRDAPMKYFTLNKEETSSYTKYNKPYIKTWNIIEDKSLNLIDIMNRNTRNSVKRKIGSNAFNIAFPVNTAGNVYRFSEENTKSKNNDALRSICELGEYDGYIMNRQVAKNTLGVGGFHSEVGLCPHAFNKLKLVAIEKAAEPPRMKPRSSLSRRLNIKPINNRSTLKRKRNNTNNTNNKNNNYNNRITKRQRLNLPSPLFNNL
jgi:hypothetical protein